MCHDLLIMSMRLRVIAILNTKGSDYCSIVSLINKNGAINLLQNADLTKKKLFPYIKMGKDILTL